VDPSVADFSENRWDYEKVVWWTFGKKRPEEAAHSDPFPSISMLVTAWSACTVYLVNWPCGWNRRIAFPFLF